MDRGPQVVNGPNRFDTFKLVVRRPSTRRCVRLFFASTFIRILTVCQHIFLLSTNPSSIFSIFTFPTNLSIISYNTFVTFLSFTFIHFTILYLHFLIVALSNHIIRNSSPFNSFTIYQIHFIHPSTSSFFIFVFFIFTSFFSF